MGENVSVEQALEELRSLRLDAIQDAVLVLSEHPEARIADVMVEVLRQIDTSRPGGGYSFSLLVSDLTARSDQRVVKPLLGALERDLNRSGDDHQLEELACEVFVRFESTEAIPLLRRVLSSPNWNCQDVAVALTRLGGSSEEQRLLQATASLEPNLKIAVFDALRLAGSPSCVPTMEAALNATNVEVRQSALGALLVHCPERAEDMLDSLISTANDHRGRRRLLPLIPHIQSELLTSRVLPLLRVPAWKALRFDLLAILVDMDHPAVVEELRAVFKLACPSPWPRARAAAMLLSLNYEDALVAELVGVLTSETFVAGRDNFHDANVAGTAVIASLVANTADHHPQRLGVVQLLDDLRRERIRSFPRAKYVAADAVSSIVGSEYFEDYDRWVEDYRVQHRQNATQPVDTVPPSPETVRPNPWWKFW